MPRLFRESSAPVPQPDGCFGPARLAMIVVLVSILYAKGCP